MSQVLTSNGSWVLPTTSGLTLSPSPPHHTTVFGSVIITESLVLEKLHETNTEWGGDLRCIILGLLRKSESLEKVLFSLAKEMPDLQEKAPETYALIAELSASNMDGK